MLTNLTRRLAVAGIAALALGASPVPVPPLVLAAASLQESLDTAADQWAKAGHPRPVISFAASSALARQIEAGSPADLFVSADEEWMDALAVKRLIVAGTRADLVGNRLVVVEPAGGAAWCRSMARGSLGCSAQAPWRWLIQIACRRGDTARQR